MATLTVRIDDDLKEQMDRVSEAIGITTSAAINVFARQYVAREGFPFSVENPAKAEWKAEMQAIYEEMKAGNYSVHELAEV